MSLGNLLITCTYYIHVQEKICKEKFYMCTLSDMYVLYTRTCLACTYIYTLYNIKLMFIT